MTSIVCNRESMAADTRVSEDDASFYPAQKIFRVRDTLIGTAGHGFMALAFVEWFKRPKRTPSQLHELLGGDYGIEYRDAITILELHPDGIFVWNGWGYQERVLRDAHAIGSGAKAALEALVHVKCPKKAIERATGHDIYTGCHVQHELLRPKKA